MICSRRDFVLYDEVRGIAALLPTREDRPLPQTWTAGPLGWQTRCGVGAAFPSRPHLTLQTNLSDLDRVASEIAAHGGRADCAPIFLTYMSKGSLPPVWSQEDFALHQVPVMRSATSPSSLRYPKPGGQAFLLNFGGGPPR